VRRLSRSAFSPFPFAPFPRCTVRALGSIGITAAAVRAVASRIWCAVAAAHHASGFPPSWPSQLQACEWNAHVFVSRLGVVHATDTPGGLVSVCVHQHPQFFSYPVSSLSFQLADDGFFFFVRCHLVCVCPRAIISSNTRSPDPN
jgi:hypothetical protein